MPKPPNLQIELSRLTQELEQLRIYAGSLTEEVSAGAERLRLLTEQMPAGLWTTDRDLRLTSLRGSVLAAVGLKDASLGVSVEDLLRDNPRTASLEAHHRALKGECSSFEDEFRGRFFQAYVEPLRDAAGQVTGILGAAIDVTTRRRVEQRLRSLSAMLKVLVEASPLAIVTLDDAGQVTSWSPAAERIFGWRADEVLGSPLPMIPHERREEHLFLRESVLRGESLTGTAMALLHRTGGPLDLRVSATPLRDGDGPIDGLVMFFEDHGHRAQNERVTRQPAPIPEKSPDPMIELDAAGHLLYFNAAARACFPDLQPLGALHPIVTSLTPILARFRHGERKSFSLEISLAGAVYHQTVHLAPEGDLVRVFLHDVTRQHRAKQMLEREVHRDPSTGIPNRAALLHRTGEWIQRGGGEGSFAVLSLDVDRVRAVNESFGYAAGDLLISEVARRISSCLQPGDLVARLSGDDFGVLLTGIDGAAEAVRRAGLIAQAVGASLAMGGQEISPSITIGIAPGDSGVDAEDLLRNAHVAMYRAKARAPGQREIFDTTMHGRPLERFRLEYDLHRAVEHSELCLQFQPIVRLRDGTLVGFEALLCWPGRSDGAGRPVDVLRVAEETGLILPVTCHALEQVCRTLAEWSRNGVGVALHLDLSARLLTDALLVSRVCDCLRETASAPSLLVLEIAESALLGATAEVAATLAALRALGVRVAVDGICGLGAVSAVGGLDSSPATLQRCAVDLLKVDHTLTAQIQETGDRPEPLCAVLAFARSLGLEVIAQGIDLHEQVAELVDLGCGFGQGHLFSHPVDEATARRMSTSPPLWGAPRRAEPEPREAGCCATDPVGAVEAPN